MKKSVIKGTVLGALLALTAVSGNALADYSPLSSGLFIDDNYSNGAKKSWTDTYTINGTTYYNVFDLSSSRGWNSSHDFNSDSSIAEAYPNSPDAGQNGSYHWDLPTGKTSLTTYHFYVWLYNNNFTNPYAEYTIDKGYSNVSTFMINQYNAPAGWYSPYGTLQTYGTAHIQLLAKVGNSGYTGNAVFTGADAVGLQ